MIRPLLLAALLIPLGACSAPAQVDSGEGPVVGPVLTEGPGAERSPELDAARERWENAGLDAYTMTLERICFCPPDYRGPYDIEVRNGALASVRLDGADLDPERGMTVDALFELIEEAYEQKAEVVAVEFDADLGYPTSIGIDYSTMMADEEIAYRVSDLRASDR